MTLMEQMPAKHDARGSPPELPDRLTEPLQIVARRARTLAWMKALAQLLALVAGVWLAMVLLLGWRIHMPVWLGLPLALVGWAAVIYGGYRILRPLFRRKRDLAAAALLVDYALPDTEERLSSAVELSREENPAFRGSPELVACLMRQAEQHAETLDPGHVISGKKVRQWVLSAGILLLIWFVLFVVLTPNMLLGLQRMFQPWNAAAAALAPTLEVAPGDAELAQGDPLTITVIVKPPEGISFDNGFDDTNPVSLTQHFASVGGLSAPDLTSKMERTAPREFRMVFDRVQQSFTYHVSTDANSKLGVGPGQSNDFTVTVHTLPAVADVEVQYTYPAYTRIPPRTEHSREGTIDAVVGTRAHVIIHTTEPVQTAMFKVADDGYGVEKDLPLVSAVGAAIGNGMGQAAYATDITITKSTQYHVDLAKADGQKNAADAPRTITARPDNPPSIAITDPAPKAAALRVNPTDTLPVKFVATDDFGVAKLEAIVDVDGASAGSFDVTAGNDIGTAGDPRIAGTWSLKLPDILKGIPGTPHEVGFKFKATDTRDPSPQTGQSQRVTVILDKAAPPLAQRADAGATKDLAAAMQQALEQLKNAEQQLKDLQDADTGKVLTAADSNRLSDAQKNLAAARERLSQAADQAAASRLADMATLVKDVAEGEVRQAGDSAVSAGLASDQAEARHGSEAVARQKTQEAIDKLTKLSQALNDEAQKQPLAQALERLAEQQKQLAEALAKDPNNPALREQQKQLQQQLDQLIKQNPDLQKPAADANQNRLNDLIDKVHQLETSQQPLNNQMQSQKEGQNIGDPAKDLAKQQEALNRDIEQFSQDNADAMKQAGAPKPPEAGKLDDIVKQLQGNKLDDAARDQRAAAGALDQTENRLGARQKEQEENPASAQKADQATKDAAAAAEDQQKAQDLQQEINQAKSAHDPPTRPSDPANQDSAKLADDMRRQAQQMANSAAPNSAQRTAAQAASKAADAAKTDAGAGHADKAQQELQEAATQLAQAAKAEQQSAGTPTVKSNGQPGQSAGQAADQAHDLADRQRALADQSGRLAQAQQDATQARQNAAGTSEQQRNLADKISETARGARQLAQDTQGPAPQMADKIARAAQALDSAAQSQRNAAQSSGGNNVPQAAANQQQSADRLGDADQALTGTRPQQQQTNAGQRANSGEQKGGNAGNSSNAGSQANSGQAGGQSGGSQAAGGQSGSQGGSQTGGAQAGGNPTGGSQAGGAQGGGSQAAGGGSQAAGADSQAAQGSPGNQGGGSQAAGQSGNQSAGSPTGGTPNGGPSSSGTDAAAQSVQGARSAQGQAADGDPAAAERAAQQLTRAAQAITGRSGDAQATGNAQSSGQGHGQGAGQGSGAGQSVSGAGQSAGAGSGSGGGTGLPGSGGMAGSTSTGIQMTNGGRAVNIPKEVQEAGVSPSDWGRLSPDMQNQLQHAAQQPGPPGYRDMIKNYYSKIARMTPAGAGDGP